MILVIDNYDSFVYNLARYVNELGFATQIVRNDSITLTKIAALKPSHIIISPGPCTPNQAGVSLAIVTQFAQSIPILGVCLGHQAIAQAYGANIIRAKKPWHGKSALIQHQQTGLFHNIKNPLTVGRYHSLIVSEENFPQELVISARSLEHEIMALHHKKYPCFGVQFHPESVLTEDGYLLLNNFLTL